MSSPAGSRGATRAPVLLGLALLAVGVGLAALSSDLWWPASRARGPGASDVQEPTPLPTPTQVSPSASRGPEQRPAPLPDAEEGAARSRYAEAVEANERGAEALERDAYDEAVEAFGRAHELIPDNDVFASNLTEAHVRRGLARPDAEAPAKIADFEAALETVRDDERRAYIEELLARARAIADAEVDFVVESTLHFTFRFDGARAELYAGIEALKVVLEDTYQEYGDLFRRRPVEEGEPRIEVVLYRKEGFDSVTGLGDWAGGVFDGSIRVPVADLADSASVARITRVLRHEVAHAFMRSIGGERVPAWLNEGLSQWLEEPARRAFDVRMARGRLAADPSALFPLERLTGTLASWSDKAEIRRAYDQALAFTAYVADRYGTDLVFDLVAACKADGAAGAAKRFREVILVDLDVVLGDFRDELAD